MDDEIEDNQLFGTYFSGALLDPTFHNLPCHEYVGHAIIQEKATLAQLEKRLVESKSDTADCIYYLAIVKARKRIADLYVLDEKTKVHMN